MLREEAPQKRPLAEIISGLRLGNTLLMQQQKGYSVEGDQALSILPTICQAAYRTLQAEGYDPEETTYWESAELLADCFLAALERCTGSKSPIHKNTIWMEILKGLWNCFLNDCPEARLSVECPVSTAADLDIVKIIGEPGETHEDTLPAIDARLQQLQRIMALKKNQIPPDIFAELQTHYAPFRNEKLAYAKSLTSEMDVISSLIAEFDAAYDAEPQDRNLFSEDRVRNIGPVLKRCTRTICRLFGQPEPSAEHTIEPGDVMNIFMEACTARRQAMTRTPELEARVQTFLQNFDLPAITRGEREKMGYTTAADPHVVVQTVRSVFAYLSRGAPATPVLMREQDCATLLERMYQNKRLVSGRERTGEFLKMARSTFWEHILMKLVFKSIHHPLKQIFFDRCMDGMVAGESLSTIHFKIQEDLVRPLKRAVRITVGIPADMREQLEKDIDDYAALLDDVDSVRDVEQFSKDVLTCIKQLIYQPGTTLKGIETMLMDVWGKFFKFHGAELAIVFLPKREGTIYLKEIVHAMAVKASTEEIKAAARGRWESAPGQDDGDVTAPPRRREMEYGPN